MHLHYDGCSGDFFCFAQVFYQLTQHIRRDDFGPEAIAPIQRQHVLHQSIQAPRIFFNNIGQPLLRRIDDFFAQQLRCVADSG